MEKRLLSLAFAVLAVATQACGIPSKQQRIQEAAYELNMGTRFSRMDMALERVAKLERAKFVERHKKWHNEIKIDDIELAGVNLREDGDANLFLTIQWHRIDQQDMRTTVVSQKWHDRRGTWVLSGEERAQGDLGLFNEPMVDLSPGEQKAAREMQFRTTTIRE